jgi:CheY-like chemotaxis protein
VDLARKNPVIVTLVEDDETVVALLAELLKAHGHDPRELIVAHEDTVATVLDRMAAEGAAVVVLDLGMPVPGVDILERARADDRFRGVRYIVATAGFEGTKELPKAADIRSVAKPYDVPELLAAIAGTSRA